MSECHHDQEDIIRHGVDDPVVATHQIRQVQMVGAVTISATVDPVAGVVVVGDSSGAISALHLAEGSPDWSVATGGAGGAVTATPTTVNGLDYVGSQTAWSTPSTRPPALWREASPPGRRVGSRCLLVVQQRRSPGLRGRQRRRQPGVPGRRHRKLDRQINQGDSPVTGVTYADDWAVASLTNGPVCSDKFGGEITWPTRGRRSRHRSRSRTGCRT